MLAFILVLYCCILWKACYMWEIKDGREPHWKKRKERWPKAKKKEERKRGRRPGKNNMWKHKVLIYDMPKAWEKKIREKHKVLLKKKRDVACLLDLDSLYCMHMWWLLVHVIGHWLLSIIHHSLLAFHLTPKSPRFGCAMHNNGWRT